MPEHVSLAPGDLESNRPQAISDVCNIPAATFTMTRIGSRIPGVSKCNRLLLWPCWMQRLSQKLSTLRERGQKTPTTILLGDGHCPVLKLVCLYCRPECCDHHQCHPHWSSVSYNCSDDWFIDDTYSGGRGGSFCIRSRYSPLLQRSLQETRRFEYVTICIATVMYIFNNISITWIYLTPRYVLCDFDTAVRKFSLCMMSAGKDYFHFNDRWRNFWNVPIT